MKKILSFLFIFIFFLSLLSLILSYGSVYISPGKLLFPAVFGLFFPVLFFIQLFFLIVWAVKRSKWFFLSLISIISGYYRINDFYAFPQKKVISAEVNPLKIMSYNVRLFDLYNWSGKSETRENILKVIENENPDILCLQEYYSDEKFNNTSRIIDFQHTKDYLISDKIKTGYSGVAIFSRYPIISSGYVEIDSGSPKCIYADILRDSDTLRIYNLHLASVHLSNNDYRIIKKFDLKEDEDLNEVTGIGSKLLRAYKIRSHEVETIAPHIHSSPYRTIVCGDFNDTPVSYTYKQIKGTFKDSFIEKGKGIGNTYDYGLPIFRIDYILHSPLIETKSYRQTDHFWSDHYAVTVLFEI